MLALGYIRMMFSLTDDKAREPFSVAEAVRTMTYPGGEPLDRLPGVLNNFHYWKWFSRVGSCLEGFG